MRMMGETEKGVSTYLINQSAACTAHFQCSLDPPEEQKKRGGFVLAWTGGRSYFGNDLCLPPSVGRSVSPFFLSFVFGQKEGGARRKGSVRREKVSSWHCLSLSLALACSSKGKAKQGTTTTTTGDA